MLENTEEKINHHTIKNETESIQNHSKKSFVDCGTQIKRKIPKKQLKLSKHFNTIFVYMFALVQKGLAKL